MLSRVRAYFASRGVLEVETPALSRSAATDPNLASFVVPNATGAPYLHLHTSPEFPMKRLLAAGSGDIYQICRVFRADEAGRYHNPEFSLLEWYRLDFDHFKLMDEIDALLTEVFDGMLAYAPAARLTYREAFARHADLDPHEADIADCRACAAAFGIEAPIDLNLQQWLDVIMSHVVTPRCAPNGFAYIYHFPVAQAALARIRPGAPPLAERFELIGHGLELANGFHELTDANEQRERCARELAIRHEQGLPRVPADHNLLQALTVGLPDCAGAALGLDRLVMLAANLNDITQAMAFCWDNA
jgi:elongation factor P--(R)-beta-lysine ligase